MCGRYYPVAFSDTGGSSKRCLRQRVADHLAGHASSTRDRRPLYLIYYEAYVLAKDAKARETFLKSGSGKRFIRKQLRYYFWSVK